MQQEREDNPFLKKKSDLTFFFFSKKKAKQDLSANVISILSQKLEKGREGGEYFVIVHPTFFFASSCNKLRKQEYFVIITLAYLNKKNTTTLFVSYTGH